MKEIQLSKILIKKPDLILNKDTKTRKSFNK